MSRKITIEEIKKRINEYNDGEYTVLTDQIRTTKDKLLLRHNVCGKTYEVLFHNFTGGIGWCSHCAIEKRKLAMTKTTDEFKKEVKAISDEYEIISEYTGTNRKIKFFHTVCKKEFNMTPSNFLQGQRCPFCHSSIAHRKKPEEVQEVLNEKLDSSYKLISDYKNNHTKIQVFHEKCGNIWNTTLRDINSGNRCPFCVSLSKGEERIMNFLKENDLSFIYQFRDQKCYNKQALVFDFKVKMESENILIEYDGIQHFKPIYGKNVLERQIENDNIKNEFCLKNNIKLIRISYEKFDEIDEILTKELLKKE